MVRFLKFILLLSISVLGAILFFRLVDISTFTPSSYFFSDKIVVDVDFEKPISIEGSQKKKIILSWTTFFGAPLDDKYFDDCPDLRQTCMLTTNRSLYSKADALVFHPRDMKWSDLPASRTPNQRYLFLMHESPPHTCIDLDVKPNFFNWSLTYRLDSDIPYPYTYLQKDSSVASELKPEEILNKTGSRSSKIVWFSSNCKTHSKRELYVDVLRKYIPVDIYGECGPLKCPRSEKCDQMIDREYRFYIAFENSICVDYVSEKYYARRHYNSIPIVLSRSVAERLLPAKSYIAIDDFVDGPRQLADYLKYLTQNDTAYLEYFHWRTIGYAATSRHPTSGLRFGFCGVCERLWLLENENRAETKTYESVNKWWGEKVSCDADLVTRLIAKELTDDPTLIKRYPPFNNRHICG